MVWCLSRAGDLINATLPGTGRTWELPSPSIFVNGQTTDLLNSERTIIFDSGTSNVLFSTDTAEVRLFAPFHLKVSTGKNHNKADTDHPGPIGNLRPHLPPHPTPRRRTRNLRPPLHLNPHPPRLHLPHLHLHRQRALQPHHPLLGAQRRPVRGRRDGVPDAD